MNLSADLLIPRTAAELIGCSRRRVAELIESGELPATNLNPNGRARYVLTRADVEAFKAQPRRGRGRPAESLRIRPGR